MDKKIVDTARGFSWWLNLNWVTGNNGKEAPQSIKDAINKAVDDKLNELIVGTK